MYRMKLMNSFAIILNEKSRGQCGSKSHNTRMYWMKLMISVAIILTTFRQQSKLKTMFSQSARNSPGTASSSYRWCSQLFCFKPHECHRPADIDGASLSQSSDAAFHKDREMEGRRDGAEWRCPAERCQFKASQCVISRLWNCHQQTGNVTDLSRSGIYVPLCWWQTVTR